MNITKSLERVCCCFLVLVLIPIQHIDCQPVSILESDTLNRLDNYGKKTGYWVEYIDKKLQVTKKDKAVFWRYVYYENAYRTDFPALINFKAILKIDENQSIKDSIVLMDGIYQLYNMKDKLRLEEIYKKGKPQLVKSYNPKTGNLIEYIDYTKLYKNQEGSSYIEEYNNDGSLLWKGYRGKINGKWKDVSLDNND